ncbi:MAG: Crp/Fnr family transcriptional regulator [Bacteroidetes bacterium]|nr:Crp/Fnr family transcriptional regulator [Bacteroidota bacterium]
MTNIKEYLDENFPHFEPELKEVIAANGILKTFGPDELLMNVGQYFHSTMLTVKGNIKIYREGEEGEEFYIYMIGPGEACALSMVCAFKKEASEIKAKTVEETEVIMLPIELMDQLMQKYRTWYYFVLETYRKRFEEMLTLIDNIAFKSLDERLVFYLKNQTDKFGKTLHITHQQIAYDLNSSREVITRLLKKMEQKGMVVLERNALTLV